MTDSVTETPPEHARRWPWLLAAAGLCVVLAVVVAIVVVRSRPVPTAGASLPQVAYLPVADDLEYVPEYGAATNGTWWFGAYVHEVDLSGSTLNVYGYRLTGPATSWHATVRVPVNTTIGGLDAGTDTIMIRTGRLSRSYLFDAASGHRLWDPSACTLAVFADAVLCRSADASRIVLRDRHTGRVRSRIGIDPRPFFVVETLPGDLRRAPGLRYGSDEGLSLGPVAHRRLLTDTADGRFVAVDLSTGRTVSRSRLEAFSGEIGVYGGMVYVADDVSATFAVFDVAHLDRPPRRVIAAPALRDYLGTESPQACGEREVCVPLRQKTMVVGATGQLTMLPAAPYEAMTIADGTVPAGHSDTSTPRPVLGPTGTSTRAIVDETVLYATPHTAIVIPAGIHRTDPIFALAPATGKRTRLGTVPSPDELVPPVCAATATRIGCLAADGIHLYRLHLT